MSVERGFRVVLGTVFEGGACKVEGVDFKL